MSDIRDQAIVFETGYMNVAVGENGSIASTTDFMPEFRDIHISGVVCRDARIGISVNGTKDTVHDVSLTDCTLFCSEKTIEQTEEGSLIMKDVRLLGY